MGISKHFPSRPKQKYRKTKSPICFPIGPFRCRRRQNQLLGHHQLVVMEELFQELCAHQTVWSYPGKKRLQVYQNEMVETKWLWGKVLLDSYQTQIRQLKMQPNLWIDSRVEGNSLIAYDKIEWCYVTIKRTSLKYKLFYFKNHNKKLCLSFNTLAALHQCTQ